VVTVGSGESRGDFFPLQVVYEERYYATGKIKSSQWSKREARPNDNAILTGRLIDRSLRSLFNPNIRTEIQVVITVLSLDKVNQPDTLAVLGASAALSLCGFVENPSLEFPSNLPVYTGPVSCVRIGLDPEKNFIINPSYAELQTSDLDLVVSGNGENIVMVECGANIVPEEIIVEGLKHAIAPLKQLTQFQKSFTQ
jgi:polyribonucleotide nucleotidyltransferase